MLVAKQWLFFPIAECGNALLHIFIASRLFVSYKIAARKSTNSICLLACENFRDRQASLRKFEPVPSCHPEQVLLAVVFSSLKYNQLQQRLYVHLQAGSYKFSVGCWEWAPWKNIVSNSLTSGSNYSGMYLLVFETVNCEKRIHPRQK